MTNTRNLLMAAIIIFASACGGGSETDQATAVEPAAETAVANEDQAAIDTDADSEEAAVATTVEVVEESAGDPDASNNAADEEIVLAQTEPAAAEKSAPEWQFSEGQHYTQLTTAQGTSSPPDVIEVAEVFWYGCPHCFNFDPYLEKWVPTLPDDVRFIRLPVMWNPTNQMHARIFYTAEALNKLDVMHDEIFKEMHVNRKMLTSEDEIRQFFERFDVSEEEFNSTFRSFPVESNLQRAKNFTGKGKDSRYPVLSVPLLVVNGKFLTTGPGVKTFEDMLAVAGELVERERQ